MKKLPMVRLALIAPFIESLHRESGLIEDVLAAHDLSVAQTQDGELFVPAPTMYQLVEDISDRSEDPFAGLHVGETMDPLAWPPLAIAASKAHTLSEMLLLFSIAAADSASSLTHTLESGPQRSRFIAQRHSAYGLRPRHNDAFTVGYLMNLIRPVVGEQWNGREVLISLCDPAVVPPSYMGCRYAAKDELGITIDFPTRWLLLHTSGCSIPAPSLDDSTPALNTLTAIRQALTPHLHEESLTVVRVAEKFRMSPSTLKRRLHDQGTTLGTELARLRQQRATTLLRETDNSVAQIAAEVGFNDASVFARSFRRWTGESPTRYRQQGRQSG